MHDVFDPVLGVAGDDVASVLPDTVTGVPDEVLRTDRSADGSAKA